MTGDRVLELRAAALDYARQGLAVLPIHSVEDGICSCGRPECRSDIPGNRAGKHPRTRHGLHDATSDAATVAAWWDRWPGSNIGWAVPSGVVVLDVDLLAPAPRASRPDEVCLTGPVALAALEAEHGPLSRTREARTGSGGRHLVYRLPAGIEVRNGVALPGLHGERAGLDLRTAGGYVLLPPSGHVSGGVYAHLDAGSPADVDAWLLTWIQAAQARPTLVAAALPPVELGERAGVDRRERRWAAGALAKAVEAVLSASVQGRSRHDALRDESCSMGSLVPHLLTYEEAEVALIAAGEASGKPTREVVRTVVSGLERGQRNPRRAPAPGPRAAAQPRPPAPTDDDAPRHLRVVGEEAPLSEPASPPERTALDDLAELVVALEATDTISARTPLLVRLLSAELVGRLAALREGDQRPELELSLRLRACKGLAGRADELVKRIDAAHRARLEAAREQAQASASSARPSQVVEALGELAAGLPLTGLAVPPGWEIDGQGVYQLRREPDGSTTPVRRLLRPLLVTRVLTDVDGAGEQLELRWHDGRGWRVRVVPRGTCAVGNDLARLGAHGLPVDSSCSRSAVAWISAFAAHNALALPHGRTATTLGWRDEGFLWGQTLIGPAGASSGLAYASDDAGQQQRVGGYRSAGTWDGWCNAVRAVAAFPALRLALAASVAAALLHKLPGAAGFALDLAGRTSTGKTSALRLAASVWGEPDEQRPGSLVRSWDTSATGVEREAALACDLPMILDDTKRLGEHTDRAQGIVYAVTQGAGRTRGTVTGTQRQATWRTVLLSTGEEPLSSLAPAGGAAARILTLWGSPFGAASEEGAAAARGLRVALAEHYGHLGPRLAQALQHGPALEQLRAHYVEALEKWGRRAGADAVAQRASGHLALLDCALLALDELEVPPGEGDPMDLAWKAVQRASRGADREAQALQAIFSWASARREAFEGRHREERGRPIPPPSGWLGRWDDGSGWQCLCIQPEALRSELARGGYDPDTILASWADREWLRREKGRSGFGCKTRHWDGNVRMIQVLRSALVEVECCDPYVPQEVPK